MVEIGPLSPPGTIDLNTGASIRNLPVGMARLAVALGGCPHPNAVPVDLLLTGERIAVLCPDCDTQLPAEWDNPTP